MSDGKVETDHDVLVQLEQIYQQLTGGIRNLRLADRLVDDLELDSLKSMELMVAIEDRFDGVRLFDEPLTQDASTVQDLVTLIRKKAR